MTLGNLDSLGIGRYEETTAIGTEFSDYMNLGLESVSAALATLTASVPARRQLDTTNSQSRYLVQHGAGKILGNGTATITETVTFPVAFGATPIVIVSTAGGRTAGAFNMAGLSSASSAIPSQANVSTSAFDVTLRAFTGTLANTTDWYYTWIAIGVPA